MARIIGFCRPRVHRVFRVLLQTNVERGEWSRPNVLHLRYLVDPKKRRNASTFIYREVFQRVQKADDIQIASETMDPTVHTPKAA